MRRVVKDPFKEAIVEKELAKEEAAKKAASALSALKNNTDNLDEILKSQLLGLSRLTNHLVAMISAGETKDMAQQLSTCIKVTMELKAKEKELLEDLSTEELEALADED